MKGLLNSYLLIAIVGIFTAIAVVATPVSAKPIDPTNKSASLKEKLREAVELITQATVMAVKAEETGDLDLAKKALEMNNKGKALLEEVAKAVKETGDPEMELATCNVFDSLVTALDMLVSMADKIAKVSTDPKAVRAAEELKDMATEAITMARLTFQRVALACIEGESDEAFEEDRPEEKTGDGFKAEEASAV